jgi:hypothetical protein
MRRDMTIQSRTFISVVGIRAATKKLRSDAKVSASSRWHICDVADTTVFYISGMHKPGHRQARIFPR